MKPLVSCICITQNRRFFLRQAVQYFKRSQWGFSSGTELVILDGSEERNPCLLMNGLHGGNIGYFHEPSLPHAKTGALHNRACELARGDIIIQWDDDDWQSPNRIIKQVQALTAKKVSERSDGAFAFTSRFWWYHLGEKKACPAQSWAHGGGSAGATFAYHRKAWEAAPFRDVDQGEDNFFWQDHAARGTPMIDMIDPELLVYIRHNRNGSHAISDTYTPEDTEKARATLGDDVAFYDELSEILPLDDVNNPSARWREQYDRSRGIRRR